MSPIVDGLPIVRTALSPGFVFRDRDLIQDGDVNLGFLISQSRCLDNAHQRREIRLDPGDATMMQASEPGRVGSGTSFGYLEIMIPPAEWDARNAKPGDVLMRRISGRSEAMRLLRGYLRLLEQNRIADCRKLVRQHVIDLVVLAAKSHHAIGESSVSSVIAVYLGAALNEIASSFEDPELSLASVASRLHISSRYLQRVMNVSGMSFTEHVNELRLRKALSMLTASSDAGTRIADVALKVGFSDISHFNRLFRSRFGDTPSGVRLQHRCDASAARSRPRLPRTARDGRSAVMREAEQDLRGQGMDPDCGHGLDRLARNA